MKEQTKTMKIWSKFPVWLKSILIGFVVNTIGVGVWVIIANNVPLPYSIVVMAGLLVLYIKFFKGGFSKGERKFAMQRRFRNTSLNKNALIWAALAGFCLFIFLNSGLALTFRFKEFNPEVFKTATFLETLSPMLAWPVLIMASLVAGICEEIGFRGYMQEPMERKYGPMLGITITSVVFVAVHLHQAWSGGILPQIFFVSIMIGYLAYATNSLIPGIITHTLFDVINFSYWWSSLIGTFQYKPIGQTGIDTHFIIILSVTVGSMILFGIAIKRILSFREQSKLSKELQFH